jgi:hypothetical protein
VKQLIAGYIEGKTPDIGVGEGPPHAKVPDRSSFKKLKYDPHLPCATANQQERSFVLPALSRTVTHQS